MITKHRLQILHEFYWDNIKMLDKGNILNKLLSDYYQKQFIYINKNSLNLKNDTEFLDPYMFF